MWTSRSLHFQRRQSFDQAVQVGFDVARVHCSVDLLGSDMGVTMMKKRRRKEEKAKVRWNSNYARLTSYLILILLVRALF